jgi:hypothetical protein
MGKATKIRDSEWLYRGGKVEHLGRRTGMRAASWRWAWCGASGLCASKDDCKKAIDFMLREAQRILQSEQGDQCPDQHLCRHGIDN